MISGRLRIGSVVCGSSAVWPSDASLSDRPWSSSVCRVAAGDEAGDLSRPGRESGLARSATKHGGLRGARESGTGSRRGTPRLLPWREPISVAVETSDPRSEALLRALFES